ncbi:MAG: enoyl-CoA hydratase/isomerase family protein [Dichotomicrobium sp.]
MEFNRISVEITERIATLVIDHPDRLNAMSLEIRQEMIAALRQLEESGEADAVIITGAGEKAFSAGADINEVKTRSVTGELSTAAQLRRELPFLLERLRLPTLACINGYCLGAGLEMALACTLRIASENAKIGLPEINLGVLPGSGGTQRLTRMVGVGRAMEMVTLGEPVSAQRACDMGLVNAVHPPDQLMEAAFEIARKWQSKGPVSLACARDAVLRSADVDITTGLDYENKLFALCLASGERDEGVSAFLEKRKANFRNT